MYKKEEKYSEFCLKKSNGHKTEREREIIVGGGVKLKKVETSLAASNCHGNLGIPKSLKTKGQLIIFQKRRALPRPYPPTHTQDS